MEALDPARIRAEMTAAGRRRVPAVEVHDSLDSTNTWLINLARNGGHSGTACLAERQWAGRGRRGREWVSPYRANLYLSLLWRFAQDAAALAGLSLACGVAVARTLEDLGVAEVGLKWPNDLLWQGCKLGGILLEFGQEDRDGVAVVAGVGINVAMPAPPAAAIDQPWVDLQAVLGPGAVSRNVLAARLLDSLAALFDGYGPGGRAAVRAAWSRFDLAAGRRVELRLPAGSVTGIARGVDETGALLLETPSGLRRFLAGEVSLRFGA